MFYSELIYKKKAVTPRLFFSVLLQHPKDMQVQSKELQESVYKSIVSSNLG